MARGRDGDRLVYSSEQGRICPLCGKTESRCRCRGRGARARLQAREAAATSDGVARVGRSTKGRKGKDKARRTHELHGSYSAKHLRIQEEVHAKALASKRK